MNSEQSYYLFDRLPFSTVFSLICLVTLAIPFSCSVMKNKPKKISKINTLSVKKEITQKEPHIRVALFIDVSSVNLSIDGQYKIVNTLTQEDIKVNKNLNGLVNFSEDHFLFPNNEKINAQAVDLVPEVDGSAKIQGTKCYGSIRLVQSGNGKKEFTTINILPMEKYLPGVLKGEIYGEWHISAHKAAAVAARSYAMASLKEKVDDIYDVASTVASQVYKGAQDEDSKEFIAVKETAGMILKYQGDILKCYYHSCCGGHTEDARNIGFKNPVPDIKGVVCGFCEKSKHYRWKYDVSLQQASTLIRKKFPKFGTLRKVVVSKKGSSNRAVKLLLYDNKKQKFIIRANDFRLLIGGGAKKQKSAFCSFIVTRSGKLVMKGRGWGHGAGMCQFGMSNMADQGFPWQDILKKYYYGAELIKAYE